MGQAAGLRSGAARAVSRLPQGPSSFSPPKYSSGKSSCDAHDSEPRNAFGPRATAACCLDTLAVADAPHCRALLQPSVSPAHTARMSSCSALLGLPPVSIVMSRLLGARVGADALRSLRSHGQRVPVACSSLSALPGKNCWERNFRDSNFRFHIFTSPRAHACIRPPPSGRLELQPDVRPAHACSVKFFDELFYTVSTISPSPHHHSTLAILAVNQSASCCPPLACCPNLTSWSCTPRRAPRCRCPRSLRAHTPRRPPCQSLISRRRQRKAARALQSACAEACPARSVPGCLFQ